MSKSILLTAGLAGVVGLAAPANGSDDPNARPTIKVLEGVHQTNLGDLRPIESTGHVLTSPAELGRGGASMLYAPTEVDDPAYRAAISGIIGGPVDYYDARIGTPSVAEMSAYTAVHVWINFAALDTFSFGDNLAAYVDGGGVVIMGAFCTYDIGNSLQGMIRTPAYSPVANPSGGNAFTPMNWDGMTCGQGFYDGVVSLNETYRDRVVPQGTGAACGHWLDGEITTAYNTAGPPVYMANGSGGFPVLGTGEIARWIANCVGPGGEPVDCQCDGVYSVGDRVHATVDNPSGALDLFEGNCGTVICGVMEGFSPVLLVEWDDWFNGHGGNGFCACPEAPVEGNSRWYVDCGEAALGCSDPGSVDCQCDAIWTAGDRVHAAVDNPSGAFDLFEGNCGTVICGSPPGTAPVLLIEWDDWFNGHGGNGFCFCPDAPDSGNSRWYVDCDEVLAGCACVGDLDGDGDTDVNDLLILLGDWGCSG